MNFYSIRHLTRFRYSQPISESIMETRMHPRSDSNQHCLTFTLSVSPRCRVFSYRDHLGNNVQHFDIPGEHNQLVIVAESVVEQQPCPMCPLPRARCMGRSRRAVESGDYWEMLLPSHLRRRNSGRHAAAKQMGVTRRDDPLMLVQELNQRLFDYFDYVPSSHARRLAHRRGHRQRQGRLPGLCAHHDRPAAPRAHSRALCLRLSLPQPRRPRPLHARRHPRLGRCAAAASGLGGLRPTNNLVAHHRHIRTAVGRDYADVPPTHGIFRGSTDSELYVAVQVEASETAAGSRPQAAHPRRLERAGGARPAVISWTKRSKTFWRNSRETIPLGMGAPLHLSLDNPCLWTDCHHLTPRRNQRSIRSIGSGRENHPR
jgi:hypothetical protein